jgi:Na+/melibiose symporter-like transporter
MTTSALMLTGLGPQTSIRWLVLSYVIFGIGFGMINAPITNTAVSGMPRSQAGVAAATASTSRQVGQSLGVAVVGSVVASGVHGPLSAGFTAASHQGWWIVAGCGAAVLVLAIITTGRWARGTAASVAASFPSDQSRIAVTT